MMNYIPLTYQDTAVCQFPATYSYQMQVSDNKNGQKITDQERSQCLEKTEALWNIRDLGGYKTNDGKTTKFHIFLRSNVPCGLNENDIKILKDYGLSTVIDLRILPEVHKMLNSFTNVEGVEYHNIEFDLYNKVADETKITTSDLYINNIKNKEMIKKIFDAIASAITEQASTTNQVDVESDTSKQNIPANQGVIMFHCKAGRDRTAIVAMLLLGIANVKEEDIIKDYLQTFDNIRNDARYEKSIAKGGTPIPSNEKLTLEINKVISYIKDNHKSFEQYLLDCGISEKSIKSIKDRLV